MKLGVNIAYSIFYVWWLTNTKTLIFLFTFVNYGYLVAWTRKAIVIWISAMAALTVFAYDVLSEWMVRIEKKKSLRIMSLKIRLLKVNTVI